MVSGPRAEKGEHFARAAEINFCDDSGAVCKRAENGGEGPKRLRRKKVVE